MTRTRTAPATNVETSAPKLVTNFDRLLAILERNAANVQHEPELARRPRDAIREIRGAVGKHKTGFARIERDQPRQETAP
jgi:hypothetical protein